MTSNYDTVYQVEIINEIIARVYGRVLNMCIKAGYDLEDTTIFECQLLKQIKEMDRIDLFEKNLDELAEIDRYWTAMSQFTKDLWRAKNTEVHHG